MMRNRRPSPPVQAPSAFAGFRFPPDVMLLAVRWYLRYSLSYPVRSHVHERGVEVDHVTLFRWVQRFTPELIDAARPCRHATGNRWSVDEAYVKVHGVGGTYRAIDQHGQTIDANVASRRDIASDSRSLRTFPRSRKRLV
jgi:IS6 family transposase